MRVILSPAERRRVDAESDVSLARRRVLIALARSTEGATARELRRWIRSEGDDELTPGQITGALRHLAAAGLAWRGSQQHSENVTWEPSPALFVAAVLIVPEEILYD